MNFLEFLAEFRTYPADIFFQLVTYMAQEAVVVAIICWLYWCSDKKLAYTLGFSYFTSGLLVQGLKITFRVPRPWVLNPEFKPVASAVPDATGYSFPSGHTQSGTALFGTLGFHLKKVWAKALCWLAIALVGFSRMYLGCHTPKDVLTSFALSIVLSALSYTVLYRKELFEGHEKSVAIAMGIFCFLIEIYTFVLYYRELISLDYASDCMKAAGAGFAFAIGYYIEKTQLRFQAPDNLRAKLLRFVFGLAVTLVLMVGLKPLLGENLSGSWMRYFLIVSWITVIYPRLFIRHSA